MNTGTTTRHGIAEPVRTPLPVKVPDQQPNTRKTTRTEKVPAK